MQSFSEFTEIQTTGTFKNTYDNYYRNSQKNPATPNKKFNLTR